MKCDVEIYKTVSSENSAIPNSLNLQTQLALPHQKVLPNK